MEGLQDFLKPEIIWFVVGILLVLAELMVPGLVIIFFGIGACIVGAICFFAEISLNWQLVIFTVTSIVSLVLLRRSLKGMFMGHVTVKQDLTEDLKEYIGEKAVVVDKITPSLAGKVEFHGTNWNAEADEDIAEGAIVKIINKDNLTLKVKPV